MLGVMRSSCGDIARALVFISTLLAYCMGDGLSPVLSAKMNSPRRAGSDVAAPASGASWEERSRGCLQAPAGASASFGGTFHPRNGTAKLLAAGDTAPSEGTLCSSPDCVQTAADMAAPFSGAFYPDDGGTATHVAAGVMTPIAGMLCPTGSSCNYSSGVNSPCEKPECQTDPTSTECMIAVVGYCASESGKMDPECQTFSPPTGSSCNYSSGVNSPCEKPECQTDPMSTECMIAVVGYCASESGKMDPECQTFSPPTGSSSNYFSGTRYVNGTTTTGCCEYYDVAGGEAVQPSSMGIFAKASGLTSSNLPVYKNSDGMYLYYGATEYGFTAWGIGANYSGIGQSVMANAGGAVCPAAATGYQASTANGGWTSYDMSVNCTQGDVHAYMPLITCQAIQEAYKKQQCCKKPDADFQLAPTAGNSTSYTFTCQAIKEAYKNQQCCTKPYANFQLPAAGTRRAKDPKGMGADWVRKLETLSVLHKQGLITNQEFQAAKMRLVDTFLG